MPTILHALKGQNRSTQGNALGSKEQYMVLSPERAKESPPQADKKRKRLQENFAMGNINVYNPTSSKRFVL